MIELPSEINALRQRVHIEAVNPEPSKKTSERRTISWAEIEDWQQDNEYIIHGYRRSVFHLRNSEFTLKLLPQLGFNILGGGASSPGLAVRHSRSIFMETGSETEALYRSS